MKIIEPARRCGALMLYLLVLYLLAVGAASSMQPAAAVELTDLQPRVTPGQPPQIVAVLKNTGKRTVRTRGTLTLFDKRGTAVSQSVVPDVPVLPESEREVATAAINPEKSALPAGEYRVELKIDVGMAAVIVGETTFKVQ